MMDEEAREKIRTEVLGIGDLFSYSHLYFSREIWILLGITTAFKLPSNLLWNAMIASGSFVLLLGFLLIWIAGLALLPFCITWMAWTMKKRVEMGEVSDEEAWREAWKRYMPLAWVMLLQGLLVVGGLLMFIVPGVMWMIDYIFGIYVVSALPIQGQAALDYSKALVKGHWFEVFVLFALFTIVSNALPFLIDPKNLVLKSLTDTCIALITPYSLFPFGIWFLNLYYLHERTPAETVEPIYPYN